MTLKQKVCEVIVNKVFYAFLFLTVIKEILIISESRHYSFRL